jgi:voltage-gated potassium channel
MTTNRRKAVLDLWERWTGLPLLILSLVFLAVYAAPIIEPDLPTSVLVFCEISQNSIWAIFIVDVAGRFILSSKKMTFLKRNVIDILAVLLPFLRPLRALRVLSVATIGIRRFGGKLRNRVTFYVIGVTFILWFVTGLAVTEAERGAEGANIANVWQGWWWSFITLATVGYGDKFPVTPEGQWIAVIIVLTGIALLGTISATLASWFMENLKETEDKILQDENKTLALIEQLLAEVQDLRADQKRLERKIKSRPKP